ncbi:MAG: sodium:proton antiporter, partial [Nitrosomonadaceae bacterium]|nr:sodium:proton antiporter [Nitrosomonadaceae bacterium]
LIEEPMRVLAVVAIIIVGKSMAAMLLVLILRYPLNTSLTVAASLGQIGEFSFILAGLGLSLNLMPPEGMSLVLAGALISIAFNPIAFAAIDPFRNWILKHSALARKYENRDDPYAELPMSTERKFLKGQVVLVGYGHVGQRIAGALNERNIPYIVAEQNRELVQDLRKQGMNAVSGDATEPSVLIQAHITDAAMLVIATPDPLNVRQMIDTARTLNPDIEIVLRSRSEDETALLRKDQIGTVFFAEEELASSMSYHILNRFNKKSEPAS